MNLTYDDSIHWTTCPEKIRNCVRCTEILQYFIDAKWMGICPYCKKDCHGLCKETEKKCKELEEN